VDNRFKPESVAGFATVGYVGAYGPKNVYAVPRNIQAYTSYIIHTKSHTHTHTQTHTHTHIYIYIHIPSHKHTQKHTHTSKGGCCSSAGC